MSRDYLWIFSVSLATNCFIQHVYQFHQKCTNHYVIFKNGICATNLKFCIYRPLCLMLLFRYSKESTSERWHMKCMMLMRWDQVNQFLMWEQFQDVNISKDQCQRTKGYNIALLLQQLSCLYMDEWQQMVFLHW